MITIYGMRASGNCYKVRLLLAQLGMPYERRPVDVVDRSNRRELLGALNPALRIPTLILDDGRPLAESDAILHYLAEGTPLLPDDRYERAQTLQWLFFEQYSHEPYVATPRFILKHLPPESPRYAELPDRLARGRAALQVMETHLSRHAFFVADSYTIADIALYAYTHVADESQLDLEPYSAVRRWLARVADQPNYLPITQRPS